ncbi:archease [Infirmifilum lucidum]|uniref:Protein archease n=1 Tax=Infirmifilum lucidum TaxID=2776706 RepID=A0A7L9FF98_9CREN|nr:archease [Infirmifilum lucidum]QOJ78357.1 archease [Infirmifilum lucidum]
MGGFEILPHTADVLVKAWGDTLEEALSYAILGFYEVMTDTSKVTSVERKTVRAEGFDLESMLYNLIESLVVLFDEEAFIASRVEGLTYTEDENNKRVEAVLAGEKFNMEKHESRVLIKAATYHLMKIWIQDGKWYLQYVVDI